MGKHSDIGISELLLLVREGDELAFSELVERYTPMLNKVISLFHGSFVESGEAYTEAYTTLYRAAASYDLTKVDAVTFGLYARICIYRRLCDMVKKELPTADTIDESVDEVSVGIEDELVAKERMQRAMRAARELLSDYEYEVFSLYVMGYTTAEIAAELQKTAKSVDNAKNRLWRHLREHRDEFTDII